MEKGNKKKLYSVIVGAVITIVVGVLAYFGIDISEEVKEDVEDVVIEVVCETAGDCEE